MSYNIDFHYCQGQLKSFSLFGKAKNCHELANKMASCHHHKSNDNESKACAKEDKNCCNNETKFFESENDNLVLGFDYFDFTMQSFIVACHRSPFLDSSIVENEELSYANYRPPIILKDISTLFETFLL
jgi:hypothetical protein